MDGGLRHPPAEHYDEANDLIQQGVASTESSDMTASDYFLWAMAETLQGLLKAQMET